jgi:hypothetical protein
MQKDTTLVNRWSRAKCAWWRPGGHGYTTNRQEAGLFDADEPLGPHSPSVIVALDAEPPK